MKKAIYTLASAVSLLPLMSVSAYAQSVPSGNADEEATTSDIIVTARRREENLSEVPLSISAFSGETLERKNIVNMLDVVKITPGLNISTGGTRTGPFITIRGQSKGVIGNIQPGVIVYLNEVPLPNTGTLMPTFDVGNLQVLKGPQGTLFGRNALGGALLVTTQAPTHEFGGYIEGEMNTQESHRVSGAVNVPIIKDVVALRLAAEIGRDGGSVDGISVDEYTVNQATGAIQYGNLRPLKHRIDSVKTTAFRASLLIEPNDAIRNVTVFDHTKVQGNNASVPWQFFPTVNGSTTLPFAGLPSVNCAAGTITCNFPAAVAFATQAGLGKRYQVVSGDPSKAFTRVWGISNTTSIDIGENATLKNIFGYRETTGYANTDVDGTGLTLVSTSSMTRLKQVTDELQLSGSLFGDALNYTIGGFYFKESPNGYGGQGSTEVNFMYGLSHNISGSYLNNQSKAVYGQFDYSLDPIIPGLTLTAGARQTWDSVGGCAGTVTYSTFAPGIVLENVNATNFISQSQCNSVNGVFPANTFTFQSATASRTSSVVIPTQKFKKLTYTLGFNWKVTDSIMVYGTRRRGYRSGSVNSGAVNAAFLSNEIQAFAPETLDDWEAGAKIRWDAGSVRGSFDVAAFTGKDKGLQMSLGTSTTVGPFCVPQAAGTTGSTACTTTAANAPGVAAGQNGGLISNPLAATIVNGGNRTVSGFEASATITNGTITLGAGIAHVKQKVDSANLAAYPNFSAYLTAANRFNAIAPRAENVLLIQTPSWAYNLDLDVQFPDKLLDSDVSFNANFKHSGSFLVANTMTVPSYNVIDARLTFGDIGGSGIDASVYVRNLTDELYYTGGPGSLNANGYYTVAPSAPRTFGLALKYRFGAR